MVAFEDEFPGGSWLSTRVVRELEVVGANTEALVASVARRYGLSHVALNVLAVIEGNGGPLPAGTVGARVHVTSGTMTSVLDTLERNGYIERLADPGDRRRVLVEVTREAQALLDRALPDVARTAAALLEGFDDGELQAFRSTLARINEAIASLPEDAGTPIVRRTPPGLKRTT